MRRIVNAGAVLLGLNLAIEVGGHALELGHHRLDLRDLAPFFVDLELPQTNERLTRLHRLVLPRSPARRTGPVSDRSRHGRRLNRTSADRASTTLVFGFHVG